MAFTDLDEARFETHNLPLLEPDPVERPRFELSPVPVLLHRSSQPTSRIAIYVQAGIIGAPLTGRHDYRPLALALDKIGCSLLVTQSSTARRTEFIKFDTCVNDIRTAIEWAKAEGYCDILLIGVSMGGPRVAFWNAVTPDPAVKAIIFMSAVDSAYLGNARNWSPEQRRYHDEILDACRERIASGDGDQLVTGELMGRPFPMSAEAYLSFFGQLDEMNASALKFAKDIQVPTLVIHATGDVGCPPAGAQDVYDALSAAPFKDLLWVEGADHQLMAPGWSLNVVTDKITEFAGQFLA